MAHDPKEINRLKQSRRNALLNLSAKRMGFKSWSNFGKQFSEALSTLGARATEAQVNAEIDRILSATLDHLTTLSANKKTADAELSAVFEEYPPLRKWNYKPTSKPSRE